MTKKEHEDQFSINHQMLKDAIEIKKQFKKIKC
jgi:hypothetical protein